MDREWKSKSAVQGGIAEVLILWRDDKYARILHNRVYFKKP